jgi:hypothetical protein
MPREKSLKRSAATFCEAADEIILFLQTTKPRQTAQNTSWLYDHAIIRLYRSFETLMLDSLIGAISNDTRTVSQTTGIPFPQHLTEAVCEFLITGTGNIDFKGRDGLIMTVRKFVPQTHYLLLAIKRPTYGVALERLSALRNFAAHESDQSREAALKAVGENRIASSGSWLKTDARFQDIVDSLKALAREIENAAPY